MTGDAAQSGSFSTIYWTMGERKKGRILSALLILAALVALSLILSTYGLVVSRYEITSDIISAPIRIVQLTDLHNSEFGENNTRLIEKVAAQEPDLILITGDLLNQNEERTDVAETLISGLAGIAPVYVSFGNHERGYESRYGADIRAVYEAAGAAVLEYDWMDLELKGQTIRLGGIYGYCLPAKYASTGEARPRETEFLAAFQDTVDLTVLMCHMPVCWIINGSLDEWDVDLVFSGHSHGGQARFPLIGGLWAPDQGWFPGRMSGLYRSSDGTKTMVLSRGLGNTEGLPRFNNIPEVLVLDLLPAE